MAGAQFVPPFVRIARGSLLLFATVSLFLAILPGKIFSQEQRRAKSSLLQEDFPFQGACVSAKFPTNNIAMKGLAIRVAKGDRKTHV